MRHRLRDVADVAAMQMCCGCGACAYVDPAHIEMIDVQAHGRRPRYKDDTRDNARVAEAMAVCPGLELSHGLDPATPGLVRDLLPAWGPVLELWEGYASESEVRYAGSSGGVITALALCSVERIGMRGVLHTAAQSDAPYLNCAVFSTGREAIVAAAGSRYAPASPCEGLARIECEAGPSVFIGKPCDVAAVWKLRQLRPSLDRRLGLTIVLFCAGTPSLCGTLRMLERMGVTDPTSVRALRYRGNGWPGRATVTYWTPMGERISDLTYGQSWGEVLQKYRQWRCYVCADHTGEFADISVGDPWYRQGTEDDPGQSLILVRTERGRAFLRKAVEEGYVKVVPVPSSALPQSQPSLLKVRGSVWARVWVSRLFGAAAPRYRGMPTFRFWVTELSLRERAQSVYGTVKRVFLKGLRRRQAMDEYRPAARPPRDGLSEDRAADECSEIRGASA